MIYDSRGILSLIEVRLISWALVIIATNIAFALPSGDVDTSDQAAKVIAEAILAHDRSVRSLDWSQDTLILKQPEDWQQIAHDSSAFSDVLEDRDRWVVSRRERQAFDDWNRWACDLEMGARQPDGSLKFHNVRYAFDGEVMRTLNVDTGGGLIRPPDVEARASVNPRLLLGRYCDWRTGRRLGELLLDSSNLRIVKRDDESGEVVISGEVEIAGKWKRVVVTANRHHDWMPTQIRTFDALLGILKEDLTITNAENVGGVWIPTAGHRSGYSINASGAPGQLGAKLEAAAERAGLDHDTTASDAQVRAAMRREVLNEFPDGVPVIPLGDGTQILRVTEIHSVNEDLPEERFVLRHPPGTKVYDVLKDEPIEVPLPTADE